MNDLNSKLDELLLRGQTEVADHDLYAPIPPKEDCLICFLPMREDEICYMSCCGKLICFGCAYSSTINGLKELCAFCRQPFACDDGIESVIIESARLKKRMEHEDPKAFTLMADQYCMGKGPVEVHFQKVLNLYIRAAEAYCNVASKGFVTGWKAISWFEVSAKKGFYKAHEYLGEIEETSGNINTAIKHWTVAANAGSQYSLNLLMKAFKNSQLSKEGLGQVLRAFQASIEETKSKGREDYRRAKAEGVGSTLTTTGALGPLLL